MTATSSLKIMFVAVGCLTASIEVAIAQEAATRDLLARAQETQRRAVQSFLDKSAASVAGTRSRDQPPPTDRSTAAPHGNENHAHDAAANATPLPLR